MQITADDDLDTFESFCSPLWERDDSMAVALVNVGVGRKHAIWIDKCVLLARNVVRLSTDSLQLDSFVIGAARIDDDSLSEEVVFRSDCVRLLLFSDSKVHTAKPSVSRSTAKSFVESVDFSNRNWANERCEQ